MKHETAGDPMTGLKWTRRTTEKIAEELREIGITVCANTVCKLLRRMGYALRVNQQEADSLLCYRSRRAVCLHRQQA